MAFSPNSTSEFSANIAVDREPVKIIAFGLDTDEFIEVLHLVGESSGDNFEAYKPLDGSLRLTSDKNELVLGKSGRYRLRFEGTHGNMHCFWWQFSMTHEWANEVLAEGLRKLCECLQPPPFGLVAGPGIQVNQLNGVTWRITNAGIINASDSTTIDHTVADPSPPSVVRYLLSAVKISGYEGNLVEARPDGLYVNLSSELTACGLGANIQQTRDPLPLRLVALDPDNCLTYVDMDAVAQYICTADCTPEVALTVTKVANTPVVIQGQAITYTITIGNSGPDLLTDCLVTDVIPASFVGFGPFPVVYSGGASGPATVNRNQLSRGFFVDIPSGGSVQITTTFGSSALGSFDNVVTATPPDIYTVTGNRTASATVFVGVNYLDLAIVTLSYPAAIAATDVSEFNFVVTNFGNNTATQPQISAVAPIPYLDPHPDVSPVVFVTYSWTGATVSVPYGDFAGVYTLLPIPPGGQVFIRMPVVGRSIDTDPWSQSFSVQDLVWGAGDADPANNSVTLTGTVTP
jgi:uncharacterized repeat protein (TIGR01451 family)